MDNKAEKYCKHCGEIIDIDCVVCPKCGKQVEELKGNRDRDIIINNSSSSSAAAMSEQIKRKLPWYLNCFWIFTLGMLSGGIYWIVGFVLRVIWKTKN